MNYYNHGSKSIIRSSFKLFPGITFLATNTKKKNTSI